VPDVGVYSNKAQYIAIYLKPGFGGKKDNEGKGPGPENGKANAPSFFRHQWNVTHLVSTNWSNMSSSFDINCLSRAPHGVFMIWFYVVNTCYLVWLTSFKVPLAQEMQLKNKKSDNMGKREGQDRKEGIK